MTVGSLFSGIGGFDLGLERAGMRVIWQSEIDPYASAVLRKHWPNVPNHGDIRSIRAGVVRPDLICGGFPCQPFSQAGKRRGKDDDRHLWPEMFRVISDIRPAWVVGENVAGFISLALDAVLSDLETLGYATRTFVIPAVAVDAPHRRDRCWIIARDRDRDRDGTAAHSNSRRCEPRDSAADRSVSVAHSASAVADARCERDAVKRKDGHVLGAQRAAESAEAQRERHGHAASDGGAVVADGNGRRLSLSWKESIGANGRHARRGEPAAGGWRRAEPGMGGTFDGVSKGLDGDIESRSSPWSDPGWEDGVPRVATGVHKRGARLRCLGNAIVPQIAEAIGRAIIDA